MNLFIIILLIAVLCIAMHSPSPVHGDEGNEKQSKASKKIDENVSLCGLLNGNWTSWTVSKIIMSAKQGEDTSDDANDSDDKGEVKMGRYELINSKITTSSFNGEEKIIEEVHGNHVIGNGKETLMIRCDGSSRGSFYSKAKSESMKSSNDVSGDESDEAFASSINDKCGNSDDQNGNGDILLFKFDLQPISSSTKYSQGKWKPLSKASTSAYYQLLVDYSNSKFSLIITRNGDDESKTTTIISANKSIQETERSLLSKYGPLIGVFVIMMINTFVRFQTRQYTNKYNSSGVAPGPAIAKAAADNRKAMAKAASASGNENASKGKKDN